MISEHDNSVTNKTDDKGALQTMKRKNSDEVISSSLSLVYPIENDFQEHKMSFVMHVHDHCLDKIKNNWFYILQINIFKLFQNKYNQYTQTIEYSGVNNDFIHIRFKKKNDKLKEMTSVSNFELVSGIKEKLGSKNVIVGVKFCCNENIKQKIKKIVNDCFHNHSHHPTQEVKITMKNETVLSKKRKMEKKDGFYVEKKKIKTDKKELIKQKYEICSYKDGSEHGRCDIDTVVPKSAKCIVKMLQMMSEEMENDGNLLDQGAKTVFVLDAWKKNLLYVMQVVEKGKKDRNKEEPQFLPAMIMVNKQKACQMLFVSKLWKNRGIGNALKNAVCVSN